MAAATLARESEACVRIPAMLSLRAKRAQARTLEPLSDQSPSLNKADFRMAAPSGGCALPLTCVCVRVAAGARALLLLRFPRAAVGWRAHLVRSEVDLAVAEKKVANLRGADEESVQSVCEACAGQTQGVCSGLGS
eukprot:6198807-Pleurochrysis_carterae.AAC.1